MSFPPCIVALPAFEGPFDARRLVADGCQVLFASYPAGTTVDDHVHSTHNVGVITKGELILTVEGRETRHGPGQWYEVPTGAVHAARFDVETAEIELWFDDDQSNTRTSDRGTRPATSQPERRPRPDRRGPASGGG